MNLHIDLPDPKFCDGCPCLYECHTCELICGRGYVEFRPRIEQGLSALACRRPAKCIEENGE